LQRQQGTSHAWQTVATLNRSSGSGQLKGLPLGTYLLRIADLGPHMKVLADQRRGLAVFGNVPLSTLFAGHAPGVYTTPSRTFSYVARYTDLAGSGQPALTVSPNHCRSVHLDFVAAGDYDYPGQVGVLTVTASVPQKMIGALDAALVPGKAWSLNVSQTGGSNAMDFYLNGSASCDSAAPI
jgi:hypothetical protein